VRDVVDTTGTSQNHVVFDSFGNVTSETNPGFDTRFSFTGREFDAETGNYDYRSRPYNPGSGRFMEEAPIRFSAGDANLYRYVGNSPVDSIDPFGLRGYRTIDDRVLPLRMQMQGGGGGGSGFRGNQNFGGSPTQPIPTSFPVNIYGYPNRGVFDGQDFYNPSKSRTGDPELLPPPVRPMPTPFPFPSPFPSPIPTPPKPDPNTCKTCKTLFPNLKVDSELPQTGAGANRLTGFLFKTLTEANVRLASARRQRYIPGNKSAANEWWRTFAKPDGGAPSRIDTICPGQAMHFNVQISDADYRRLGARSSSVGSIGECNVCVETPKPHPEKRYAILNMKDIGENKQAIL
jgi:RHS repeat-associated protein